MSVLKDQIEHMFKSLTRRLIGVVHQRHFASLTRRFPLELISEGCLLEHVFQTEVCSGFVAQCAADMSSYFRHLRRPFVSRGNASQFRHETVPRPLLSKAFGTRRWLFRKDLTLQSRYTFGLVNAAVHLYCNDLQIFKTTPVILDALSIPVTLYMKRRPSSSRTSLPPKRFANGRKPQHRMSTRVLAILSVSPMGVGSLDPSAIRTMRV